MLNSYRQFPAFSLGHEGKSNDISTPVQLEEVQMKSPPPAGGRLSFLVFQPAAGNQALVFPCDPFTPRRQCFLAKKRKRKVIVS